MNNLDVKLNDIEDKIVSERLRKADLRKRVELREKKIHSEYIKKWNSGVLNNETFINNLNKIQKKFKKLTQKIIDILGCFMQEMFQVKKELKMKLLFI